MTPQDKIFFRNLLAVVSDEKIHGILVKFAQVYYDKAIEGLKRETDPVKIYKLQGEIRATERLLHVKEFVTNVINTSEALL